MSTITISDKENKTIEEAEKIIGKAINSITNDFFFHIERFLSFIGFDNLTWINITWIRTLTILSILILFAIASKKAVNFIIYKLASSKIINLDQEYILILRKPLYTSIILLSLVVFVNVLTLPESIIILLFRVILSLILFLWISPSFKITKILLNYFAFSNKKHNFIRPQTFPLFLNTSLIILSVFFLYLLFAVWGLNMGVLIASAGFFGLAVGFAAKDTLANLFSGVFIIADRPYKIEDYVVLDTGERGKITHIGIRSTRIITRDDVEITVPNSIMGNSKIINESGGPYTKSRVRIKVSIAYGTDIDKVRDLLMSIATDSALVCTYPEPRIRFRNFGNSGMEFELLCWIIEPELKGRVIDELNTNVYAEFMKNNIEIPYQKQDLYIKQLPKNN